MKKTKKSSKQAPSRAAVTVSSFIILVALVFALNNSVNAAPPGGGSTSQWKAYSILGRTAGTVSSSNSEIAYISVPIDAPNLAFLTTTSSTTLLGNLTGKTLTASLKVTSTGSPEFKYGGGSSNTCATPANFRFYFTTNPKDFNLSTSQHYETEYWWSNPVSAVLNAQTDATITETFDSTRWSNPNGHSAADPLYNAGFRNAVANIKQIGIGFGGGCFFDVGVGVKTGTGTAVVHLLQYLVK